MSLLYDVFTGINAFMCIKCSVSPADNDQTLTYLLSDGFQESQTRRKPLSVNP